MEITKSQIAIMVLAIFVVLLFPIPMSRSKEELYTVDETYYDQETQVVMEDVSVPYQVTRNMRWSVTWKTLTNDRQWGAEVGTQIFDSAFRYDWGTSYVFGSYDDSIGFTATGTFYCQRPGMYTFMLGSDDGSMLYLDNVKVIDLWTDGSHSMTSALWFVSEGWHTLTLHYYEWISWARVRFDIDKGDLFTWQETQYTTVQIPRVQTQQVPKQRVTVMNRTVTETVYLSILEYLVRGGKP